MLPDKRFSCQNVRCTSYNFQFHQNIQHCSTSFSFVTTALLSIVDGQIQELTVQISNRLCAGLIKKNLSHFTHKMFITDLSLTLTKMLFLPKPRPSRGSGVEPRSAVSQCGSLHTCQQPQPPSYNLLSSNKCRASFIQNVQVIRT